MRLSKLSDQEIDLLTVDDLNALVEKYKDVKRKPTIIGEKPYIPFLAGIKGDTWMSVGDKI